MTSRDVKFVSRLIVMVMAALVAALGVRVTLESKELTKVFEQTPLRDLLVLTAPLVPLAFAHYMLALRSHGIRSLATEGLVFLTVVCVFLSITLPYYFGYQTDVPVLDCSWWKLWGCSAREQHLNPWLLAITVIVGVAALICVQKREGIIWSAPKKG